MRRLLVSLLAVRAVPGAGQDYANPWVKYDSVAIGSMHCRRPEAMTRARVPGGRDDV